MKCNSCLQDIERDIKANDYIIREKGVFYKMPHNVFITYHEQILKTKLEEIKIEIIKKLKENIKCSCSLGNNSMKDRIFSGKGTIEMIEVLFEENTQSNTGEEGK